MKYMLDTHICIYLIKKKLEIVLTKLNAAMQEGVGISAITLAELEHGVALSAYPEKNADALALFLSIIEILPFDTKAAIQYGLIRADLQRKGMLIGQMDFLIAAHAKAYGLILVTNNVREFARVDGLIIEDWTKIQISFDIIGNDDPFFYNNNQTRLRESIDQLEAGLGVVHELIEVEADE
jgi:tRNA(fMet)-specific endonuclease VapC